MRRCLWPQVVRTQVAELNDTRGLAEIRAHPGRGGAKTRGWSPACRGGRGGQRGYRGGTQLPNSLSAPSPSPAVCLGLPEGRGVSDQPCFPRQEALAPGRQSVLAASQCPNFEDVVGWWFFPSSLPRNQGLRKYFV